MTNILLVEDNPIDALLMCRVFSEMKKWPTEITLLDDGQKALWYLRSLEEGGVAEPPSAILLDVNLPRFDGFQVLEAFRNSPGGWNIPIFLLSSAPSEDIAALAGDRRLQADGYFEKPFALQGFEQIASRVRDYCATHAHVPFADTFEFSYAS